MDKRLEHFSARDVQAWVNEAVMSGMAPHTPSLARKLLSQICKAGVEGGRMSTNPVRGTEMPPIESVKQTRAWSTDEARHFLASVRGDQLEAFWWALLTTGLRQGEVRGPEWQRVNLTSNTLPVNTALHKNARDRGPTKTREDLSLAIVPELAQALFDRRDRQRAQQSAYGPSWPLSDWVFTRDDGRPLRGEFIRAKIREAARRAGLEPLRPHEQRHTTVTLMASSASPYRRSGTSLDTPS
jgi:integrase